MSHARILVLLSIVLTASGVVFSDTVSVPQVVAGGRGQSGDLRRRG